MRLLSWAIVLGFLLVFATPSSGDLPSAPINKTRSPDLIKAIERSKKIATEEMSNPKQQAKMHWGLWTTLAISVILICLAKQVWNYLRKAHLLPLALENFLNRLSRQKTVRYFISTGNPLLNEDDEEEELAEGEDGIEMNLIEV